MAEAQHTSGDWYVHEDVGRFFILCPDPKEPNDPWHIAKVVHGASDCTSLAELRTVDEANARVLAAAPLGFELARELLRACDRRTGREISDVTRLEIEPLRKLAEKFMAAVEGS